jgi:hypothetical protein
MTVQIEKPGAKISLPSSSRTTRLAPSRVPSSSISRRGGRRHTGRRRRRGPVRRRCRRAQAAIPLPVGGLVELLLAEHHSGEFVGDARDGAGQRHRHVEVVSTGRPCAGEDRHDEARVDRVEDVRDPVLPARARHRLGIGRVDVCRDQPALPGSAGARPQRPWPRPGPGRSRRRRASKKSRSTAIRAAASPTPPAPIMRIRTSYRISVWARYAGGERRRDPTTCPAMTSRTAMTKREKPMTLACGRDAPQVGDVDELRECRRVTGDEVGDDEVVEGQREGQQRSRDDAGQHEREGDPPEGAAGPAYRSWAASSRRGSRLCSRP